MLCHRCRSSSPAVILIPLSRGVLFAPDAMRVNMKTAKAIGLTAPTALLVRAGPWRRFRR
jgi:hypothetical protein